MGQVRSQYKYHTLGVWMLDFALQEGKGREGNARAYLLAAGEAPDEETE